MLHEVRRNPSALQIVEYFPPQHLRPIRPEVSIIQDLKHLPLQLSMFRLLSLSSQIQHSHILFHQLMDIEAKHHKCCCPALLFSSFQSLILYPKEQNAFLINQSFEDNIHPKQRIFLHRFLSVHGYGYYAAWSSLLPQLLIHPAMMHSQFPSQSNPLSWFENSKALPVFPAKSLPDMEYKPYTSLDFPKHFVE